MPVSHLVVLAVLQGIAEALPLSRSAHTTAARIWLEETGGAMAFEDLLHVGTALALITAARRRLFSALGEGVRAIARPSLFQQAPGARDAAVLVTASAVSLLFGRLAHAHIEPWRDAPMAVGLGLLLTGTSLASTLFAPRGQAEAPTMLGAVAVGMVHGAAVFPGASPIGAALALLLWLGVRGSHALDLAFLITVPALLASFAHGLGGASVGLSAGKIVLGLSLAFAAAWLASEALRALVIQRRLSALSVWIFPLSLAMLAYAHALPPPR